MNERTCLAIILAAGQGTRMKSALPKVLHTIGGLTLVGHVATRMAAISDAKLALVIGKGQELIADAVRKISPTASVHIQDEQHGTAHAVLAARSAIEEGYDDILVVFGDTPFVTDETIARLRAGIAEGAAVTVAGMEPDDPAAYGRMITDGDDLLAIREFRDASASEREITLCNGGLMAIDGTVALELLTQIGNDNDQNEYYLPVVVEVAVKAGHSAGWVAVEEAEILGINDRAQLADAESRFQTARRQQALADGVGMIAPETVYFSHDTQLAADVMIEANVIFAPGVRVEAGAIIRAFSHLEGAAVATGAIVGPFARLRPGAKIGPKARVGNFSEVKNADVGPGAKVNHLSYVGDATIGARANIGAGTITCNYDGYAKYRTIIGEGAFIGSNSALIAPVTVGKGAYIASGSVITGDVSDDALAIGRGRQVEKPGRARTMRERAGQKKQARN